MYDAVGRAAIRFALTYARRRYRREIRIGVAGLAAVLVALFAYFASRDVPEG
ncbi:MAG TPA: hypothetical protein VGO66_08245 [Solirubrobacterales bacterium]|jgi:hypothetical protein|nr:hypothetical protein [Solirubrobacterales bacterium]